MSSAAPAHPGDLVAERLAECSARLVDLQRQRAEIDAAETRLLAESAAFADLTVESVVPHGMPQDQRRSLARRSACAMLAMATRTPERTMQRRINDAEMLVSRAPAALDALAAGRVSIRHTRVIVDQLHDIPVDARAAFVAQILPVAESSTAARLTQRARTMRERLHPESISVRSERSAADRRVELEPAADGMAWLHLFTTASVAHGVRGRLDVLAVEERERGDDRTLAQLRADALGSLAVSGVLTAEMIDVESEVGSLRVVPRPVVVEARVQATVQVTVPVLTLLGVEETPGDLDGYGPIDPDTARRLAVSAPTMTRILTHPETGAVLSVGRDRYRVPADLQRAVRLRDVSCRAPGCSRRARSCDLDHSVAWEAGGTTSVGNLACLCRHHHRLKHLSGWALDHGPSGVLTWTTPDGSSYRTEPEVWAG